MLTYAGRYVELDDRLRGLIEERFDRQSPLRVHDMAASNAITSLELFEKLNQYPNLRFTASDYRDHLRVVTPPGQEWSAVLDQDGNMLQAVSSGAVFPPARRFRWSRLIETARSYAVRLRLSARIRIAGNSLMQEVMPLWHPECMALAAKDQRFVLRREDIFNPQPGQYELLRVMGTIARFSEEALPGLFGSVLPLVADGGLFVAGDTGTYGDDRRSATIFERRRQSFVAIDEWNGGFSLRAHVEGTRLPSP